MRPSREHSAKSCSGTPLSSPLAKGGNRGVERSTKTEFALVSTSIRRRPGFTIVEMVVVIAVILVLLGIVLPAGTTMWNSQKKASAENTIAGVLKTVRAKAIQGDRGEMGLFFFLDDEGVQKIVMIAQDPNDESQAALAPINSWRNDTDWNRVYTTISGQSYTLLAPLRVTPRYVVENATTSPNAPSTSLFSPQELANDDLLSPGIVDEAQRHRNFFSMIYSTDGQLQVGRDVLIRDINSVSSAVPIGDLTGLKVAPLDGGAETFVDKQNNSMPIDVFPPSTAAGTLGEHLVVNKKVALNFPSVDGLLVYDDSLFRQADDADKRRVLLDNAQPFYVHRRTGVVMRGPIRENEAPVP